MKRRVIVCALINKNGKYLFIRQNKVGGAYPGTIHIPGGGLEDGENLDDAIRREVREETGLEITNLNRIDFDADIIEYKGETTQMIFLQYTCDWASGEATPSSDAAEIIWKSVADILENEHSPPSQRFLRKLSLLK